MVQPEDNRIRNSRLGRLVATALRSYFLPIPPATTRLNPVLRPFSFERFSYDSTGNPFPPLPSSSLPGGEPGRGALRPITRSFQQIKFGGVAEF